MNLVFKNNKLIKTSVAAVVFDDDYNEDCDDGENQYEQTDDLF